jgi:hypothetical protein
MGGQRLGPNGRDQVMVYVDTVRTGHENFPSERGRIQCRMHQCATTSKPGGWAARRLLGSSTRRHRNKWAPQRWASATARIPIFSPSGVSSRKTAMLFKLGSMSFTVE